MPEEDELELLLENAGLGTTLRRRLADRLFPITPYGAICEVSCCVRKGLVKLGRMPLGRPVVQVLGGRVLPRWLTPSALTAGS